MTLGKHTDTWRSRWTVIISLTVLFGGLTGLMLGHESWGADGAVLYVGKGSTYPSLELALLAAKAGDSIVVGPGQYNESMTVSKDRLTISGNSSAQTVLRGQGGLPVLDIRSNDVTVAMLRIEEGAITSSSANLTLSNLTILCSTDPAVDLTQTRNCTISDTTFLNTTGVAVRCYRTTNTRLDRVSSISGTLLLSEGSNITVVSDCAFAQYDTGLLVMSSRDVRIDLADQMEIGGMPAHFQDTVDIRFGDGSLVQSTAGQFPVLFERCTNITVHDLALSYLHSMVEGVSLTDCSRSKVINLSFSAGSSRHAIGLIRTDYVEILESNFTADGANSGHVIVRGTVNDMSVSNCTFTVNGDGSEAVEIGQGCKVNMAGSLFFVEAKVSSAVTVRGNGCTFSDNIYYVGDEGSVGMIVNGTGPKLTRETMFISGSSSRGVSSIEASGLHVLGSRLRVTGSSAVGMDLDLAGACTINATIVNTTEEGGPCLRSSGGTLFVVDTELNTRSSSQAALIENGDAYIRGTWFHGNERGLDLLGCSNVLISDSTFNALKPLTTNSSNEVLIYHSDMFDLFIPVDGVRAHSGSRVFLHDSHFEGLHCDATSEITVKNSITFRTLSKYLAPLPGVDIRAVSDGAVIYQTAHFSQWGQPRTDQNGLIIPLYMTYERYVRSDSPVRPPNTVEVYLKGTAPNPWSMAYPVNAIEAKMHDLISPDIDLPMVPRNLTADAMPTKESIFLNWDLNTDDTTEYWIYMEDDRNGSMMLLDKVPGNFASYTTEEIGENTLARFELRSWDGTYLSGPSDQVQATTVDLTPPSTPTGLTADLVTHSTVKLAWEHPGTPDLSYFQVLINRTSTSALFNVAGVAGADDRTFTVTGLSWNTWYQFRVISFDQTGNGSPPTPSFPVQTHYPPLEVAITVRFDVEGPFSGNPANGSEVALLLPSGTRVQTAFTGPLGTCRFTGLLPDEEYLIEAYPPEGTEGEEGTRAGYLRTSSAPFSLQAGSPTEDLELVLPYQSPIVVGLIKVRVEFGGGPRSGPVHLARITLSNGSGGEMRTVLGSTDGKATFSISELPFSGTVKASPPLDLTGNPSTNAPGYLEAVSDLLQLTVTEPAPEEVHLLLPYFEGTAPPRYLYISRRMPTGTSVNLDTEISITFDQPVDRSSVEAALKIEPSLTDPVLRWSADSTTIDISHDGLEPMTTYTVTVGSTALSANGTSFPPDHTENIWTFRTTADPGASSDDGPDLSLILLIAVLITALFVGLIVFIFSRKNREDVQDEEEDLFSETLKESGGIPSQDYPSDLAEDMMSDMPRASEGSEG